jgi:hypothetical protein
MATTYSCDVCKRAHAAQELVSVEVLDGEYPGNGSTMHASIDFCVKCLKHNLNLAAARQGKTVRLELFVEKADLVSHL